jgi:hypothetical protein
MDTLHTTQDHNDDPLDQEDSFAPGWTEEPGDKLRGTLINIGTRDAGFGPYPIYTIAISDEYEARTREGFVADEVAIHASRNVLRRKLENAKLSLGDEFGVKYIGPPEGDARSHRYTVVRYEDGRASAVSYEEPVEDRPPDEGEAETQAALEAERATRDAALSE